MKTTLLVFSLILSICMCIQLPHGYLETSDENETNIEEKRINSIADLMSFNLQQNGWNNILLVGDLSDIIFTKISHRFDLTIAVLNGPEWLAIEDVVPYQSQYIIISAYDFESFEIVLNQAMKSPYWHPLANIILYYHTDNQVDIPRVFFIFWFYRACNVIIIQYDDSRESLLVTTYSPYISGTYKLPQTYGCWKTTKLGIPVRGYNESFTCEEGCDQVTINSKLRDVYLGTCIGFDTMSIDYGNSTDTKQYLFEDKGRDLHGFVLKAYAIEVLPFLDIHFHEDGSFTMSSRDGELWNVVSERLNFGIDLNATKEIAKMNFDFEVNINLLYTFSQRQADLLLFPIYMFDLIVIEVDMTYPYRDGGVCIVSHRADFETVLFQSKLIEDHYQLVLGFVTCYVSIWALFITYQYAENGFINSDMIGKAFLNTHRNVLTISIRKFSNRDSFRIYMAVSLWAFFAVSFLSQASIISFFSSYKRGKEVDTFDDVIDKGYVIEGMASPDILLPSEEETTTKINSKILAVKDVIACVEKIKYDKERFCLINCPIGRYLARNSLENGVQYLHIAEDKMHDFYLTMLLHKHSPLTASFNKYVQRCVEGGLISKWEQYKFYDVKEESPIRPLSMIELMSIFRCYGFLLAISFIVFVLEIIAGIIIKVKRHLWYLN